MREAGSSASNPSHWIPWAGSICSTVPPLPAPSLLASQTLIRGYKAEALSREEESNKSMGAGEQEPGLLLLEEGAPTLGSCVG